MGTPYLSEIRIMSFPFAPKGWTLCNGATLPINQNQALFSLLGTTFGGNGQTTFGLPDLRGRAPMHVGNKHVLGEKGGEQAHTLTVAEMPQHNHTAQGSSAQGTLAPPSTNLLANTASLIYAPPGSNTNLQPGTISNAGGSQAHNNMQPYLVLSFCIALQGVFPSQN